MARPQSAPVTDPRAAQALHLAQTTALPITGKLVDGQRIGSFQYREITFSANNADEAFSLKLDRKPQGCLVFWASAGGVVFNGSNNRSDWTPTSIVLQTTVAGTYGVLVG